jgi:magnesium chelatase family protein
VVAARQVQQRRSGGLNARLDTREVAQHCELAPRLWDLLAKAAERRALSPRACHRILKVARTIADLDDEGAISESHLAEAISLKQPGNHATATVA